MAESMSLIRVRVSSRMRLQKAMIGRSIQRLVWVVRSGPVKPEIVLKDLFIFQLVDIAPNDGGKVKFNEQCYCKAGGNDNLSLLRKRIARLYGSIRARALDERIGAVDSVQEETSCGAADKERYPDYG